MPTRGEAMTFLEQSAPLLFGPVGSMLYIGHRHDTHPWWRTGFAKALKSPLISINDIDAENLRGSRDVVPECVGFHHGDIRIPGAVPDGFGLVFWDEGPEHVPQKEALETILMLKSRHDQVLISCPWGYQKQGTDPRDPEFHHWAPMPEHFEEIGMTARVFGEMFPAGHGNLVAWF